MAWLVRLNRNSVSDRVARYAQKTSGSSRLVSTASQLKTRGRSGSYPTSAVSRRIGAAAVHWMKRIERPGAR